MTEGGLISALTNVAVPLGFTVVTGGEAPLDFNLGRSNLDIEPAKRYKVDGNQFDLSLGFPMQDHSNTGDTSVLYGMDKHINDADPATDLGAARYMIDSSELPIA